MTTPVYGTFGPALYAAANSITHTCLGRDVSIPIEMPHPQFSAHGAWINGELVGVGVAHVLNDGSGYLESLAVLPAHRNLGIATELVSRRCSWLASYGVPFIVAHSWCSWKFGPQSAKALVKNGFWLAGVRSRHYWECSDCPVCVASGEGKCRCDAWEYRKVLLDA